MRKKKTENKNKGTERNEKGKKENITNEEETYPEMLTKIKWRFPIIFWNLSQQNFFSAERFVGLVFFNWGQSWNESGNWACWIGTEINGERFLEIILLSFILDFSNFWVRFPFIQVLIFWTSSLHEVLLIGPANQTTRKQTIQNWHVQKGRGGKVATPQEQWEKRGRRSGRIASAKEAEEQKALEAKSIKPKIKIWSLFLVRFCWRICKTRYSVGQEKDKLRSGFSLYSIQAPQSLTFAIIPF